MSVGKPSEAAKTPGLKQRIESGVPGFSKTPGLKQRIEALGSKTPGGTWTMAKDNALFNSSPSECGDTPAGVRVDVRRAAVPSRGGGGERPRDGGVARGPRDDEERSGVDEGGARVAQG